MKNHVSNLVMGTILVFSIATSGWLAKENSVLTKTNLQYKTEREQLVKANQQLKKEHRNLMETNERLKKETETLTNTTLRLERELEVVSSKNAVFNEMNTQSYIFDPETIKEGDIVSGLMVKDINRASPEKVDIQFEGYFVITGKLVPNLIGGTMLSFNSQELYKVPHSTYEMKYYNGRGTYFHITNEQDVKKAISAKFENFKDETYHLHMTAVFSDFHYYYLPQTDVSSFARFEKIVVMNEKAVGKRE